LGPYQIISLLGTGGMGQVYKAFDARLRRDVAIKVAAERFSERFDREVRAVAALNHPNICTVHDVGPNYLVMELVDGETLREWCRRARPVERSLEIARQVLEALGAAHRTGVVHRDPKPENVMVHLAAIVQTLIRKRPAERYPSAEAVLEALAAAPTAQGSSPENWASPKPLTSIAVLPFVFLSDVEDEPEFKRLVADLEHKYAALKIHRY
jgi:hypothetical protein